MISLGLAAGKHTMKFATSGAVIGNGRLNGSPFEPRGTDALQVSESRSENSAQNDS